jgi:diacylglycerol kinase (ATP)
MQPTNQKEKESSKFSLIKRARSFSHAGRGLKLFIRTTHNAWVHIAVAVVVVVLGFVYHLNEAEWGLLVFAIGMVMTAEAFNTAIEIDIDLTSPEYHPYARDTKDVAAGAVLVATITAIVIGCIIFIPKVF